MILSTLTCKTAIHSQRLGTVYSLPAEVLYSRAKNTFPEGGSAAQYVGINVSSGFVRLTDWDVR
jgi:hypothetical protein